MWLFSVDAERTCLDELVQALALCRHPPPVEKPDDHDGREAELEPPDCGAGRQRGEHAGGRRRPLDHDRAERLHVPPERREPGRLEHLLQFLALYRLVRPHVPNRAAAPDHLLKWAILPQIGYSPDSGPLVGAKYTERNRGNLGVTVDFDGTVALNRQQQSLTFAVGTPHLREDRFLTLFEGRFVLDPEREFFGLGNDDVPDALSAHEYQRAQAVFAFGWRPMPTLALDASLGIRYVSIRKGPRDDGKPFTTDRFPELPGVHGGYVNPVGLGLVWTTRDDVIRPTHGWRLILKVAHTDRAMQSDFEFTRLVGDVGYLVPLFGGAHVFGVRLNGGFVFGPGDDIPFWELEDLGGDDTLRGFLPRRFYGTSRLLLNTEYRFRVTEFDFFHLWHVRVDGVAFGDTGRVFVGNAELRGDFHLGQDLISRNSDDFRYSYGGGLRFQLSEALVARVDVGFSEEETGLTYLEFGHTF